MSDGLEAGDQARAADEAAGMIWWNKLPEAERATWLRRAAETGGTSAADAWAAFKATQPRQAGS